MESRSLGCSISSPIKRKRLRPTASAATAAAADEDGDPPVLSPVGHMPGYTKRSRTSDVMLLGDEDTGDGDEEERLVLPSGDADDDDDDDDEGSSINGSIDQHNTSAGALFSLTVDDSKVVADDSEGEWTREDIQTLLERIRDTLPKHDIAKYSTQTERTDWSAVEFGGHTRQQCKAKWMDVITKVRRYRTMSEVLADCMQQVTHPSKRSAFHPDMPKKPLTPFFRFFNEHRQQYAADHPNLSVTDLAKHLSTLFKQITPEAKQAYVDMFNREYAQYKETMSQFRLDHPEMFAGTEDGTDGDKPPKPTTALFLYIDAKANEEKKKCPQTSRKELHEKYRKSWADLPDKHKLKYIKMAVDAERKYEEDMKVYCCLHPDYEPKPVKSFLSKAEQRILDKEAGRPEKPPPNGYGLFTQELMPYVLNLPNNERMQEISRRWKVLTQTQRDNYNTRAEKKNQVYKEAIDRYLLTLPADQRRNTELQMAGVKVVKELPKEERPLKPINALYLYLHDRRPAYERLNPGLSESELNKLMTRDYSRLPDRDKMKYKLLEEKEKEKIQRIYSQPMIVKKKKIVLLPGEPPRPPASGYHLFSTRMLTELTDTPNTERLHEISRRWRMMTNKQREKYNKEKDAMAAQYKIDLDAYRETLSVEDRKKFDVARGLNNTRKRKKRSKKRKQQSSDDDEDEEEDASEAVMNGSAVDGASLQLADDDDAASAERDAEGENGGADEYDCYGMTLNYGASDEGLLSDGRITVLAIKDGDASCDDEDIAMATTLFDDGDEPAEAMHDDVANAQLKILMGRNGQESSGRLSNQKTSIYSEDDSSDDDSD